MQGLQTGSSRSHANELWKALLPTVHPREVSDLKPTFSLSLSLSLSVWNNFITRNSTAGDKKLTYTDMQTKYPSLSLSLSLSLFLSLSLSLSFSAPLFLTFLSVSSCFTLSLILNSLAIALYLLLSCQTRAKKPVDERSSMSSYVVRGAPFKIRLRSRMPFSHYISARCFLWRADWANGIYFFSEDLFMIEDLFSLIHRFIMLQDLILKILEFDLSISKTFDSNIKV